MPSLARASLLALSLLLLSGSSVADPDRISVVSVEPASNAVAPADTAITVRFDRPVRASSLGCGAAFWAFGRWSGTVSGTLYRFDGGSAVRLVPDRPFSAGEWVTVYLSHDVAGEDGTSLRPGGYSFQFTTSARPTGGAFTEVQTVSTNGAGESSRPYGGIASDVDGDGFLDITTVNEDTADLRVFLNRGDCTGTVDPFLEPTFGVNHQASPSESADFDRDGVADICVGNIATSSVSILLGAGDGTFLPQQEIAVGTEPRGVAVLDVDGDGDQDIACTSSGSGNVAILRNDGEGVFGPATFFESGVANEWALGSADMDGDGLLDLIVGGRSVRSVVVDFANGDGTFTPGTPVAAGGLVWMLVCGDVDGDGAPDVATANSSSNHGSILRNDGSGGLLAPTTHATDPFPLATDLGDLDGDGDLDWVQACFGGDWYVFRNDGAGGFSFDQEIPAPAAASCSLLYDSDADGDLDLAMIDEIADVVILYRNGDAGDDCDGNGTPDACDLASGAAADCNGNGLPDSCDIESGASEDQDGNGVPDECTTALAACGAGAVHAACGSATDVLLLNGQSGGVPRRITVTAGDPLHLTLNEPPSRACDQQETRGCVYAWLGEPGAGDVVEVPRQLGTMCYGPRVIATKRPKRIWNAIGKPAKLGEHDAPGPVPRVADGGSFELVSLPGGFGSSITVSFQGIVDDACSAGTVPFSVTNGITLEIP